MAPAMVVGTAELAAATARRPRKPGPRPVILTSIALFAVVMLLLAQRVAAGTDPVLGPARPAQRLQPVIVRRIVRRVIVETTVPAHAGVDPGSGTTVSSPPVTTSQAASGYVSAAPVTRSS